jgi:hypothetical protein
MHTGSGRADPRPLRHAWRNVHAFRLVLGHESPAGVCLQNKKKRRKVGSVWAGAGVGSEAVVYELPSMRCGV